MFKLKLKNINRRANGRNLHSNSISQKKRSAKVTTSGSGNYDCVPKCIKSTKYKVENNIKSNTGRFF